jgi:hypothetical protein
MDSVHLCPDHHSPFSLDGPTYSKILSHDIVEDLALPQVSRRITKTKTHKQVQKFYDRQARVDVHLAHQNKGALRPAVAVRVTHGPHAKVRRDTWWPVAELLLSPLRWRLRVIGVFLVLTLAGLFFVPVAVSAVLVSCALMVACSSHANKKFPKVPGFVEADKAWCRSVQDAVRLNVAVTVNSFQIWHVDWFFTMLERQPAKFMPLLPLFPNMKEVTESVGMFRFVSEALRAYDHEAAESPDLIVVVGDGSTCRTACLFAALWPRSCRVHSIDPNMRKTLLDAKSSPAISALADVLSCHRQTVQDWLADHKSLPTCQRIILVAVHSHAALDLYVPALRLRTENLVLATMPCCVPQVLTEHECSSLGLELVAQKVDWGVASDKRTLYMWAEKS